MAGNKGPAFESREQLLMRVLEQNKQMKTTIMGQEKIIEQNRIRIESLENQLSSQGSSSQRNSVLDYSTSVFGDGPETQTKPGQILAEDPYSYDPWAEQSYGELAHTPSLPKEKPAPRATNQANP